MKLLAVVGSRYFTDYNFVEKKINEWVETHGTIDEIVSGGARGVDTLAEMYAQEYNIPCVIFKAKWHKYGISAGPKRNSQIVKYCTHMLAFPKNNSRGTIDSIKKAKNEKRHIVIHEVSNECKKHE